MTNPDGLFCRNMVKEFGEIGVQLFQGVIFVVAVDDRASMARHVQRESPEPKLPENRELVAVTYCQFRPAVNKDQERAIGRSGFKVKN